jgi:hypothetical protein
MNNYEFCLGEIEFGVTGTDFRLPKMEDEEKSAVALTLAKVIQSDLELKLGGKFVTEVIKVEDGCIHAFVRIKRIIQAQNWEEAKKKFWLFTTNAAATLTLYTFLASPSLDVCASNDMSTNFEHGGRSYICVPLSSTPLTGQPIPVRKGDTLSEIAEPLVDGSISKDKLTYGLFLYNMWSFKDKNMNNLPADVILYMPPVEFFSQFSQKEAESEIQKHWSDFKSINK